MNTNLEGGSGTRKCRPQVMLNSDARTRQPNLTVKGSKFNVQSFGLEQAKACTANSVVNAPFKARIPVKWHQLLILKVTDPAAVCFACARCGKKFVGVLPPGDTTSKEGTVIFKPRAFEGIEAEADLVCIETPIPADGPITATWRKSESRFQIPCWSVREGEQSKFYYKEASHFHGGTEA